MPRILKVSMEEEREKIRNNMVEKETNEGKKLKKPCFSIEEFGLRPIALGVSSGIVLGTLISFAGTDDVASAFAATYPIALVFVILVCQLLVLMG